MERDFLISDLVRNNIKTLVPYSSARDEYSGSASVFLDANENPHNAPFNRYPDPQQNELKIRIAALKYQQPVNLFLGNGSDEGIDLLFRVLCEPEKDNVIIVDPTYGMYSVCAGINNVEQKRVLLKEDFSLNPSAVLDAVDEHTKMIFLCSPNNPTSNSLDRKSMLEVINNVPCMVVVDEAYIDFSREEGYLSLVPERKNLVVLQTLSKAWGLAGIRLGMVFAHPDLIKYLSAVKYPYNVNSLSIEKAMEMLESEEVKSDWVTEILLERDILSPKLLKFSFVEKVYPSDGNFLLVKLDQPGAVYSFLTKQGIIVRDRSSVPLCNGCIRITVGTPQENSELLEALLSYEQNLLNPDQ
jgi:histidinol-phosphate aminotransferase